MRQRVCNCSKMPLVLLVVLCFMLLMGCQKQETGELEVRTSVTVTATTAPTAAPTATSTPEPTATPTTAPTATPTATVAPTETPIATIAPTAAPTATVAPTAVPTQSAGTSQFSKITEENLDAYIEVLLDKHGRSIQDIYNYVRDNYKYYYRDKKDPVTMCCRMLNTGKGACWDFAVLTKRMLDAAGYNSMIVVGKGAIYSEHNWLLIEVEPGVWRHLDTERKSLKVYLVTDAQLDAWNGISKNVRYEWDKSAYPAAVEKTPEPTGTPAPTATPEPTAAPTETPEPTATPVPEEGDGE